MPDGRNMEEGREREREKRSGYLLIGDSTCGGVALRLLVLLP